MEKTNKTNEVLNYLKTHDYITSMDAIELFGATRLSAIIFCLRKKGYDIDTVKVDGVDRYGNSMVYGRYFLRGDKNVG